ncbi:MAG TPA: hypothetical protein VFC09_02010 [Candidatus Dormibacteraeota bacterium]|nr:hypothetical protein [Candidatus Dormibacteraeota bacterium]
MHSTRRARHVRLLVMLGLAGILAGCSRTPPGGIIAGGGLGGAAGAADAQTQTSADSSATAGSGAGAGAGAAGVNGAVAGAAGAAGATGGSAVAAAAASGPTGEKPIASWPGVTPTTIDIAIAAKLHNCSESNNPQESSAGTWTQKYADLVSAYVDYVNKYIPLPGGRKLKLVGNDNTFGIPLVDDGGQFCPTQQAAAGRYVVNSLKPFAALYSQPTPSGPVFDETVANGHVLDIGQGWPTVQSMTSRWPYAIGVAVVGEPLDQHMGYLADYVHKRLQSTQYTPPAGPSQPRSYGAMIYDDPFYNGLASETQQLFGQFGISVKIYRISSNTATAAQQANQVALQMKQDGVNTMIWGVVGQPGIVMANAFDSEAYYPDNLQAYSGVAFWDTDYSHTQWSRAFGIGTPSIIAERNDTTHYTTAFEGGDAYDEVWAKSTQYDGNTAQNGADGYGIWNNLMTLTAGLERSPVNFTPTSFADGLDSSATQYRCVEERFWGTDHPQLFRVAWYKDNPAGAEGYTTLYWVNKQSSFGTPGYYESYDGYYTYFGLNDLPNSPSDDTANQSVPPIKQIPHIGVDPFKSCPSIGLQGGLYEH